jgi:transposase
MPDSRTVLPAPKLLNLIGVRADANAIILAARTSSCVARCPVCAKQSFRVHSRYTRTLADLPWQGIPVTVCLRVRRFFCEEASCHRVIFAERLPGLAAHYARRTERLDGWFTHVSFAQRGRIQEEDPPQNVRLLSAYHDTMVGRGSSDGEGEGGFTGRTATG